MPNSAALARRFPCLPHVQKPNYKRLRVRERMASKTQRAEPNFESNRVSGPVFQVQPLKSKRGATERGTQPGCVYPKQTAMRRDKPKAPTFDIWPARPNTPKD